jgi:hypothetical protein
MPIAQIIPSMMDRIDEDELAKQILEGFRMPASITREDKDVDDLRKARAAKQQQMIQAQQAMEQQNTVAANADKLNQQIQPGSILESMGKVQAAQMQQAAQQ